MQLVEHKVFVAVDFGAAHFKRHLAVGGGGESFLSIFTMLVEI